MSVQQVPASTWQNPHASSMNPCGVHAYPYYYMPAPATFSDQAYDCALGQCDPMVHTTGYIEVTSPEILAFSPQMQGFLGFLPIQPYYYDY